MSTTRTENDLLRRAIYSAARQKATTTLRNLYPGEVENLRLREMGRGTAPRLAWQRAAQALIRAHREEFDWYRKMFQAQGELDAGYEPAPRGGFATGKHARRDPE